MLCRNLFLSSLALLTLGPVAIAATLSPAFNGTWKSDPAKTKRGPRVLTISQEGSHFHYVYPPALDFTYACDGHPYPVFSDILSSCTISGNTTSWTDTLHGKVVSTSTNTVSPDGKTMVDHGVDHNADGSTEESTVRFERISGSGSSMVGSWKRVAVDAKPVTLTYSVSGDTVTLNYPTDREVIKGTLGGPPVPLTGPNAPKDIFIRFNMIAPDQLHLTYLKGDKPLSEIVDHVSADGRTITSTTWPAGKESEKSVSIFEKQ